jgi:hypothetical protein
MKVIIAGSRTIDDKDIVWNALNNSKFDITEIISGGAMGVDRLGESWAHSKNIPVKVYKPNYNTDNPRYAPLLRNEEMARNGDALVAIWKDQTRGTKHMIDCMTKLGKPVEIIKV